jgi:anti-sigma factor (TIGR02949 family)
VSPNLTDMTCDECGEQLGAYLDQELDAPARETVERHLSGCPRCRSSLEQLRELSVVLRRKLPTYDAPDLLRARIDSAVRSLATGAPQRTVPAAATRTSTDREVRRWRLAALAASVLFVISTTYGALSTRGGGSDANPGQRSGDAIAHDVLSSHVRSLMPGHLTDVASTDRHNVKPWFNGRLDYSPPVYDFSDSGFPLVGGRVDYVGSRAVAVLVYQRRQHVISLFTWPAERDAGTPDQRPQQTRQGYHILSWTQGGMTRWAISDLNGEELKEFARLEQRTDSLATAREGANATQ